MLYIPCMKKIAPFFVFFCSMFCHAAQAADARSISLNGILGNKAVIQINGVQHILPVNGPRIDGVRLLSIDRDRIRIDDNGVQKTVILGGPVGTQYTQVDHPEVKIWSDQDGSFTTPGMINGHLVSFLLDTGASSVSMNENTAQSIGIDFRYKGKPIKVTTASGLANAYLITLDVVRVGDVELRNVEGAVIEGGYPVEVLLGMSFLNQLEMERKGNMIMLKKMH